MVLAIYAKMIVRIIVVAVLLITLAGLAARFALYMGGEAKWLDPLRLFDVGEERSIPRGSSRSCFCSVRFYSP